MVFEMFAYLHAKRNTHWPEGSQAPSPSLGLLVIDSVTSAVLPPFEVPHLLHVSSREL